MKSLKCAYDGVPLPSVTNREFGQSFNLHINKREPDMNSHKLGSLLPRKLATSHLKLILTYM